LEDVVIGEEAQKVQHPKTPEFPQTGFQDVQEVRRVSHFACDLARLHSNGGDVTAHAFQPARLLDVVQRTSTLTGRKMELLCV
jgi:hypothetical protein